jgi:Putative transposase of IS4/5 family (DUF4096)
VALGATDPTAENQIGPDLPIDRSGPYPERSGEQFEGAAWKFRSGAQWREVPAEFGVWQTAHDRFPRWRDAGRTPDQARSTPPAPGVELDARPHPTQ